MSDEEAAVFRESRLADPIGSNVSEMLHGKPAE